MFHVFIRTHYLLSAAKMQHKSDKPSLYGLVYDV